MQAGEPAVQARRVRREREQQRQQGPHPVAHPHRAIDVAHADMNVQAEGVVAPGDVLQPLLDAVVVARVDHRLLAVVRPRVRAGRAELRAARAGQREQRTPALALAMHRIDEVRAGARDDLDLGGDQLTGDVLVQERVGQRRRVAELLEARRKVERLAVEDRELLLETDGQVSDASEGLDRARSRSIVDGSCGRLRSMPVDAAVPARSGEIEDSA